MTHPVAQKVVHKAVRLVEKREICLTKMATVLHLHKLTLYRILRKFYGEAEWEKVLNYYRWRRGFQLGSVAGKATWFKKGELRYVNARRYKGIGIIATKKRWYGPYKKKFFLMKFIKVDNKPYGKNWVIYARWLWEQINGPIPEGMVIGHLDGNRENDVIENFVMMKPAEYRNYLEARFPKRLEQRKRRCARSQKKRIRIAINKNPAYECSACAMNFDEKPVRCLKCGNYSFKLCKVGT